MENTEQIIASSIADHPENDGTTEIADTDSAAEGVAEEATGPEYAPGGEADPAKEPEASTIPEPKAEPEDELAKELGVKGKNNRIPYSRVQAIVAKAKEKAAAELAEAVKSAKAEYETPEFKNKLQALQIAVEDPRRFLGALAQADERYAKLVRLEQEQQQAAVAETAKRYDVQPDVQLPDGTMGYSPDAVQQMLDMRAADVETRLEKKFSERFGGIVEEYQTTKQRRVAEGRAKTQLEEAAGWPGFVDNQADVLAELTANPKMSLHQAYIKAVTPKLQASRDEMRKQILAEMAAKPKAAAKSAPAAQKAAPATTGPRDTEDIIREALEGIGK